MFSLVCADGVAFVHFLVFFHFFSILVHSATFLSLLNDVILLGLIDNYHIIN